MAGNIFFLKNNWTASSWATFYVLQYLANRVADASAREMLTELIENNIPMLDLRGPQFAHLVDLIADDLPGNTPVLDDQLLQQELNALLSELIQYAREQQIENREIE
ncbi:hypothetical protein MKUB_07300 [Mycobacterium kubicae]|uniref:Uncharacterized protein n=1 Tax=Mycobacterium kubicae TaxID=120959 RepID=A0AAX1JEI7_9MYCO|nr:hypothetical protein [Mycobacterium kubicae]MCV7096904.1 hypothetical protein [Mycobacterium kubicae]OBF15970.1 hypothetical protein A5725_03690 [Mycobacterium kubicae]ORW01437.1 hypothetical protein AWC13_06505 [Mycobacterium kubicae]QNI10682.1 hypothetical protein GAN18_05180 [Mycobacterium kubicae]QPI38891.1 hypothetical protein I2456_05085 [Mycobacterium kubicae]